MADQSLASLTAATPTTGGLLYGTQSGADRKFTLTGAGASLAEAANAAAQRTALGLDTAALRGVANTFTAAQTISGAALTLSGNQSAPAWTTAGIRLIGIAGTLTDTTSAGTVAAAYTNRLGGNTIAATNATTFTNYVTSYHASPVAGTNVTFTQRWGLGTDRLLLDGSGAASQPVLALTGTPFTGGSATTTKPLALIETAGATSTGWATAGTMFGVNAASGFAGNLLDLQTAATRQFSVNGNGTTQIFDVSSHNISINRTIGIPAMVGNFSGTNRCAIVLNAGVGFDPLLQNLVGSNTLFGSGSALGLPGSNASMLGYACSYSQLTFTFGATVKNYNGNYTGAGHIVQLVGGTASSITTGGDGGAVNVTGGAAAGSGNNNGGDVVITGGAPTGSGTRGAVSICASAGTLGFYGVAAISRAVLATGSGATVDNVITTLQNLGLVKQS